MSTSDSSRSPVRDDRNARRTRSAGEETGRSPSGSPSDPAVAVPSMDATVTMPAVAPARTAPQRSARAAPPSSLQATVAGPEAPAATAEVAESTENPAAPAPTPAPALRPTRRARLVLSRVDPWSVMKLSFLLSVALAIVAVTAVAVLWNVLDGMGVFDSAAGTIADITEGDDGTAFDLMDYVGLSRVVGVATVLALVNVVLVTALATLGAFLYNLAASLVGGLHVTLSEEG